jgi:hypothetical protein
VSTSQVHEEEYPFSYLVPSDTHDGDRHSAAPRKTAAAATVSSGATPPTTAPSELALGFYADSGFGDTLTPAAGFTQRVNVSKTKWRFVYDALLKHLAASLFCPHRGTQSLARLLGLSGGWFAYPAASYLKSGGRRL